MRKSPLVSIIIPTKNSQKFLKNCLESIKKQTYKKIQLIIIDNHSTDKTVTIAKKYTKEVFTKGPERSAQRNFGAKKAKGEYLFFLDSDMELSSTVVSECVSEVEKNPKIKSLIIPEESIGEGFWAACKKLERSFYIGVEYMEATRFFERKAFLKVGGYNESLISGEDWYLSQQLEKYGKLGRIKSMAYHNEGNLSLLKTIEKKFYYAQFISQYINLQDNLHIKEQMSITKRYALFFSQPKKLFKDPVLGIGMLFLKTCEFGFGGMGYLFASKNKKNK